MTAIRKSCLIAFEDKFAEGLPTETGSTTQKKWHSVPPGFYLSHQHTRSTNRIDATGNKKWDFIAYGAYSGQWDLSFNLDYKYLDLLCAVFEDQSSELVTAGTDGTPQNIVIDGNGIQPYTAVEAVASVDELPSSTSASATTVYLVKKVAQIQDIGRWWSFDYIGTLSADNVKQLTRRYKHGSDISNTPFGQTDAATSESAYLSDQTVLLEQELDQGASSTKSLFVPISTCQLIAEDEGQIQAYDADGVKLTYGATGPKYVHYFKKCNTKKVPSFTIRQKTLNALAGGINGDEILELRGCVLKTIRFSISAGAAQINVSASGFCTREYTWLEDLDSTDYTEYKGILAEFACLFSGAVDANNYVSLVDSAQVSIANNAERLDSTCTPFAPSYYEGKTENAVNISVYSNNPALFKQRLYSGGQDITSDMDTYAYTSDVNSTSANPAKTKYGFLNSPLCKGLKPMPEMHLVSFNVCRKENESITSAIARANYSLDFTIKDCVVKSMSWQRGDGQKIMDQLSSAECQDIYLTVVSDIADYKENAYTAVSEQTGDPVRS